MPAISLPLYHGDDGLPTGVQLIGPPAREELLLALGDAARAGAAVGRAAGRGRSASAALSRSRAPRRIGFGATPEALGVGGAARARSAAPRAAPPRPRSRTRSGPRTARPASAAAGSTASGPRRSAAGGRSDRSASLDDLAVGERLRAGQLVARAVDSAPAAAGQRREHALGDVLGPDRLKRRARPTPGIGITGSSDIRCEQRQVGVARASRRSTARTPCARARTRPPRARRSPWPASAGRGCGSRRRASRRTRTASRRRARPPAPAARWRRRRAPRSSPPGWSRITEARWTTVSTPAQRVAEREVVGRGRRARSAPGRARARAGAGRARGSAPASRSRSAAAAARARPSRWRRSAAAPRGRLPRRASCP